LTTTPSCDPPVIVPFQIDVVERQRADLVVQFHAPVKRELPPWSGGGAAGAEVDIADPLGIVGQRHGVVAGAEIGVAGDLAGWMSTVSLPLPV
jgi:hypothetical protein